MPRPTQRLPSYRLHKASGQAFVELDGKRLYLGAYGTAASKDQMRLGLVIRGPWR